MNYRRLFIAVVGGLIGLDWYLTFRGDSRGALHASLFSAVIGSALIGAIWALAVCFYRFGVTQPEKCDRPMFLASVICAGLGGLAYQLPISVPGEIILWIFLLSSAAACVAAVAGTIRARS